MLTTDSGREVELDEDGFLVRCDDWTRDVALAIADELGIEMTPERWCAVEFARRDYREWGLTPDLKRIASETEFTARELHSLFPKDPAALIARIGGIPRPCTCL